MGVKASSQTTIIDITDAYSVILTSEAYTFIGNTTGAPAGLSCDTQVVAYCGNQLCSKVSIGSITCPDGISATISGNDSSSPTITFKTTSTVSSACEATIPVAVDNVTIDKKFSFSVAKTGADGRGIKSTAVTYQAAADGTTTPTGTWETSPPATSAEKPYLWTRTVITYTDGTTSTSYAIGSTIEGVEDKIAAVETRVTEAETQIEQNKEEISLKATRTDITTAINDIRVGGRNLIRNSADLSYQDYYFTEEIVVTHDGAGNLTWVSPNIVATSDGDGNVTIVASDDGNGNVILSLE